MLLNIMIREERIRIRWYATHYNPHSLQNELFKEHFGLVLTCVCLQSWIRLISVALIKSGITKSLFGRFSVILRSLKIYPPVIEICIAPLFLVKSVHTFVNAVKSLLP